MRSRTLAWAIVAATWAFTVSVVALVSQAAGDRLLRFHTDVDYFRTTAARVLSGLVPYVDFDLQYPPLVLGPALLPHALLGERTLAPQTYAFAFALAMCVALAAVGWMVMRLAAEVAPDRTVSAALTYAAATCLLVLVLPWRYEALPVLLVGTAFFLHLRDRPLAVGAALALSAATKLYGALHGPMYLVAYLRRGGPGAPLRLVAGGLLALTAVAAPFAISDPLAPLGMFGEQLERGLQVETTYAGLAFLAALPEPSSVSVSHRFEGAWEVAGNLPSVLAQAQPIVFLAVYAGVLWRCWLVADPRRRGAVDGATLAPLLGAAVVGFLLTNKVLSAQHFYWALPFVAVATGRAQAMYVIAVALTAVIYPFAYHGLLAVEPGPVLLLNLRNVTLVLLFVELGWAGSREAAHGQRAAVLRRESSPSG